MSNEIIGHVICEETSGLVKPEIVSMDNNITRIKTTLQTTNNENRNKRIYTREALQSGIDSEYVQELLKNKTFYGEAGHPISKDVKRMVSIDQGNISHIITSMFWDPNNENVLKGIVETANTRVGKDMKGLIDQGSKVAFSVRSLGATTQENGKTYIKGPLKIITYDWVIYPSHREAYMDQVITEGANNIENIVDTYVMNESTGIEMPVNLETYDLLDVLMHTSNNFNMFAEQMEYDLSKTKLDLSSDKTHVYMEMGDKKAYAKLEDYTRLTLDDLLLSKLD